MSEPMQILSADDCWQRLRDHEFGRLAYHLTDEVHIVPVNYASDGSRILLRTIEGSKLLGVVMHGDVAFEIDEVDDDSETAWSVVGRGRARILEGRAAVDADNLRLRPWLGDERHVVVEIALTEVSGRQFRLSRPWRQLLPEDH